MQYAKETNKAIVFFGKTYTWTSGMYRFIFSTVEQSRILQTVSHIYTSNNKKYRFIVLFDWRINIIFFQAGIDLLTSFHHRGNHRQVSQDRSTPRRCSTFIVADFLYDIPPLLSPSNFFRLTLRASRTKIHSQRLLTIAEDRLLDATSYHKKKINSNPAGNEGNELRPTEEARRIMWDLLSLKEDKDLLSDCTQCCA